MDSLKGPVCTTEHVNKSAGEPVIWWFSLKQQYEETAKGKGDVDERLEPLFQTWSHWLVPAQAGGIF